MEFNLLPWMPLFYDLYKRKGAIYWAKEMTTATEITGGTSDEAVGLDMNFFTFDVNMIRAQNVSKSRTEPYDKDNCDWDACFLRSVGEQIVK